MPRAGRRSGQASIHGLGSQYTSENSFEGRTESAKCRCLCAPFEGDARVAEEANHVPGLDPNTTDKAARNRRQMEVLREHHAAKVREAHVLAPALVVSTALHVIDDAVVHRVDVLAPQLTAEIDPAVTLVAARGRVTLGRFRTE